MRIVKLTEKERNNILENLLKRSPNQYSKFEDTVNDIKIGRASCRERV